jgi:predicted nucleotidyltransferase
MSKPNKPDKPVEEILHSLQERAKELKCLYRVDELLSQLDRPEKDIMSDLAATLPPGWQYPDVCQAAITIGGQTYESKGFEGSEWCQRANIVVERELVGDVAVYYTEKRPVADEGPFLREERRLIEAVAERLGLYILQTRLKSAHADWAAAMETASGDSRSDWQVIMGFLRRTDHALLARITRKMINYLCWIGAEGADRLLREYVAEDFETASDENRPAHRTEMQDVSALADKAFSIAAGHCSDEEMINNIRAWIEEEKASGLIETLESSHSSLSDVSSALDRFESSEVEESDLPSALQKSLRVSLLRRFFSDDLSFLELMRDKVEVADFQELIQHTVFPSNSHGRLGGKSTGLFVACTLVKRSSVQRDVFEQIKRPKTWYVSSDSLLEFIRHNNLDDIYDHKYNEIERIRQDYPQIVQIFKNSRFPPEMVNGLAVALDDFEDRPLIVRSSSLLEDQMGAAFSGKYKSLFVANQGNKKARLDALQDAIAEVYASIFGPDPIEYRAERGLLDVHEEMAIMIQEVVGKRVGRYFLPAYAGVAFSRNDFRWSPRIERDDGLVRLVPGLGTRAVDRLSDDYPVLFAPGQPGLRVNVTTDEVVRYSPQKIDVINLEKNSFETIAVDRLLRESGDDYPQIRNLVSIVSDGQIRRPRGLEPDWESDIVAVTLQGLIEDGEFVRKINLLMDFLREETGFAIDIEFASDGDNFYLLQCRAQSTAPEFAPAPIPRDLPREKVLFSANRYISNGRGPDITHIVYVDPERYSELPDLQEMKDVGRAVGKLNKILPKRQFVLIGPGRWGSRGDIKLGVGVTYSDINNTCALIEVARRKGNYVPELSFGTHFFQDLVEADIRYLPLYPDDEGVTFNEPFFRRKKNVLQEVLPEYAHLSDVLHVIDVPDVADGQVVKILLNADLDEGVGLLATPAGDEAQDDLQEFRVEERSEAHWRWRMRMAEKIAGSLDSERFGVKGIYVFGSVKNAASGPGSDLDLIVHFSGSDEQREHLLMWLDGWSRSLAEVNYLRTGYRSDGLLDVHVVTDSDIEKQTSYAAKIGAVTDAARPLSMGA